MRYVIALTTLAMITTASAQGINLPTATGPLTSNQTGEVIGTVTRWGDRFTMRDLKGELIGTLVIEPDGTRTLYDANGKVTDTIPSKKKP